MSLYVHFFKRILDIFLSSAALICLSPVLLVLTVLVRVNIGRPVIFKQERPGKDAKIFRIYKFRTMTDQRDKNGNLLPDHLRMTKFGAWLRKTSMDELPELVNIWKGEMSVVGPRPLLVSYLPYYSENEMHRHDVRPGLSGLAQISGRNNLNWDRRLAKDVEYVNHISFAGDAKIIILTIFKVFRKENIQTDTDASEGNLAYIREELSRENDSP